MAIRPICRANGCDRFRWARGLCKGHDSQRAAGLELQPLPPKRVAGGHKGNCRLPMCTNIAKASGLCHTHYERRRNGEENWQRPTSRRVGVSEAVLNFRPLKPSWELMQAEMKRTGFRPLQLLDAIVNEWAYRQRNGGQEPGTSRQADDAGAWKRSTWDMRSEA